MVQAMDWATHALVAGGVGVLFHPLPAFLVGFATHILLDIYISEYMPYPFNKYWWWFLAQISIVVGSIMLSPINVIFAIIGGLSPDIIDGVVGFLRKSKRFGGGINLPTRGKDAWLKESAWMAGELLFPFHRPSTNTLFNLPFKGNVIVVLLLLAVTIILRCLDVV